MQMVPHDRPSPRLLNTVAPDLVSTVSPRAPGSALLRGQLFSGNGLAIFVGLLVGGLGIGGAGWLHARHIAAERAAAMVPVLVPAATGAISTPAPIMVQIAAEHIRVTAISLGHPRLAVINDQQVGEGEFVTLHAPTARVEVKLQVVRIADGRIDLSDGTQIISATLAARRKK